MAQTAQPADLVMPSAPGAGAPGASGGWLWHWRAWQAQVRWAATTQQIARWLGGVSPGSTELLLIGASGGWMMSSAWLQRFRSVRAFDLDRWSAPVFRYRHGPALEHPAPRWCTSSSMPCATCPSCYAPTRTPLCSLTMCWGNCALSTSASMPLRHSCMPLPVPCEAVSGPACTMPIPAGSVHQRHRPRQPWGLCRPCGRARLPAQCRSFRSQNGSGAPKWVCKARGWTI